MAKEHNPKFLALVRDARDRIQEIDVAELTARSRENPELFLIDVREESEYAREHVAGARHLGKGIIERDIEDAIPDPSVEIILYCGGGFRSAIAADNLQKMGYSNVKSLSGGYRALKEAGFPMEQARERE